MHACMHQCCEDCQSCKNLDKSIKILLCHFFKKCILTYELCLLLQGTSAKISVGSHVWVEDSALAWIDGQVSKITGQEAEILTSKAKTVNTLFIIGYHN